MSPSAEDAASWALLQEVLRGKRIPPDAYTSKALSFLLRPPSRDAVVTADSFHIVFETPASAHPPPLVLLERPESVICEVELTCACPHCGATGARYRELPDGWFVCPTCCRSFARPAA
ncbi:MAG: hypothetical protein R3B48_05810 [Kofleriaceae bacterium]